jgi:hypothetical protein
MTLPGMRVPRLRGHLGRPSGYKGADGAQQPVPRGLACVEGRADQGPVYEPQQAGLQVCSGLGGRPPAVTRIDSGDSRRLGRCRAGPSGCSGHDRAGLALLA